MKRTPLQRKTQLKPKTGFRRKGIVKKKPKKRSKLPSASTVQKRCDKLLTPIIKAMHPYCELTGAPTEVAHHFVKKSKSNALRYYIPNLIPLSHAAHQALHNNESYYSGLLIQRRGLAWFEDIEREKRRPMKCDVHYYLAEEQRLRNLLHGLQSS